MSVVRDPWFQLLGLTAAVAFSISAYNLTTGAYYFDSPFTGASTTALSTAASAPAAASGSSSSAASANDVTASAPVTSVSNVVALGGTSDAPTTRASDGTITLTTPQTREQFGADALALTSDGRTIVTTHRERVVLWTADQKKRAFEVTAPGGSKLSSGPALAPTPNGGMLALVGGVSDHVTLLDVLAGKEVGTLRVNQPNVEIIIDQTALTADGKTLMFGVSGGTIAFWDLASGTAHQWQVSDDVRVTTEQASRDTGSGTIDVTTFPTTFKSAQTLGRSLIAGREFTLGDSDAVLIDQQVASKLWPGGNAVGGRLRLGGRSLAVLGIVSSSGGPAVYRIVSSFSLRGSVFAFAPDGSSAASLTNQRLGSAPQIFPIAVWNPQTGTKTREFTGHTTPLAGIAYSSDGRRVFGASRDEPTLYEWDVATGGLQRKPLPGPVSSYRMEVSADGKMLALILRNALTVVSLENGRILRQTARAPRYGPDQDPFPTRWAFWPDASGLAAGYFNGAVIVHPVR